MFALTTLLALPLAALMADENPQGAIHALRADHNAAIAARDLDRMTAMYDENAVFIWSDGSSTNGRVAMRAVFAEDFSDPAWDSVVFVRTPDQIEIAKSGVRAFETGRWVGTKRKGASQIRYGGFYSAHWSRTETGWKVHGELYVKLHCTGRRCTP
ncbi:YybH family protein [Sphingomonas sp. LT1P40]|uniref:YybH family protein n=1 Tax=Alteristakelama amylovorans TaxID=3096166 RepID=UPI002FC8A272